MNLAYEILTDMNFLHACFELFLVHYKNICKLVRLYLVQCLPYEYVKM